MPARRYPLSLDKFATLEAPFPKGVRVPKTPPGAGLPPRVVRYLRDFAAQKNASEKEITWRVPGYGILSRRDILLR